VENLLPLLDEPVQRWSASCNFTPPGWHVKETLAFIQVKRKDIVSVANHGRGEPVGNHAQSSCPGQNVGQRFRHPAPRWCHGQPAVAKPNPSAKQAGTFIGNLPAQWNFHFRTIMG
jgi:hypothetical protein